MPLDMETLGLALLVVYLGNLVLTLLVALSGRRFPGSRWWLVAQGLLVLGSLLSVLRPWVPSWVPLVAANSCFVAAVVFFAHSTWTLRFGRTFPGWVYGLMAASCLSFYFVQEMPFWIRASLFSLYIGLGTSFVGVLFLWGVVRPRRFVSGITAVPFLAVGVGSMVRLGAATFGDHSEPGMLALSTVNISYLVGSILVSTVSLYGFFMESGLQAEQIMDSKDREIEARNLKLIESSRAKDLFFSIIAHDLRGPIGGAARYVRKHLLAKMTGLEAKYTEVETLASALEKTNEFLEKLLWWSRSQLQAWAPTMSAVDLAGVIDQSVSLVRSSADLKEIAIVLSPGPYPKPWADPESVQLILGNLLSNAVKFSLPGRKVEITVSSEKGRCRIVVSDEGVGMDQATLDRLFKIEDKLTTHGTTGERGSGLGLLLAQGLAARNRGGIEMASNPGIGTKATLWLPLRPEP